jgi:hypothetical protein
LEGETEVEPDGAEDGDVVEELVEDEGEAPVEVGGLAAELEFQNGPNQRIIFLKFSIVIILFSLE